MVSSAAVLFYFIGSFIPYKAKPFGGSHCSGVSLGNHARRVKGVLFLFYYNARVRQVLFVFNIR